jgi:hypothetical protein
VAVAFILHAITAVKKGIWVIDAGNIGDAGVSLNQQETIIMEFLEPTNTSNKLADPAGGKVTVETFDEFSAKETNGSVTNFEPHP